MNPQDCTYARSSNFARGHKCSGAWVSLNAGQVRPFVWEMGARGKKIYEPLAAEESRAQITIERKLCLSRVQQPF